jgi:hypothetical protein
MELLMFSSRPARLPLIVVAILFAQLLLPGRAGAQIAPVLQYNYGSDVSGSAVSGVGAGLRFPLRAWNQKSGLMGVMTFDYFFAPDYPVANGLKYKQTYWEINMDGTYDLPALKALYVGGGFNFTEQSVDYTGNAPGVMGTALGLNALAGLHVGSKKAGAFVQGRAELWGGKQVVVSGGVYF